MSIKHLQQQLLTLQEAQWSDCVAWSEWAFQREALPIIATLVADFFISAACQVACGGVTSIQTRGTALSQNLYVENWTSYMKQFARSLGLTSSAIICKMAISHFFLSDLI